MNSAIQLPLEDVIVMKVDTSSGFELINIISCSTQLSMIFMLINVVGISTFMSRKNSLIGLSEPEEAKFLAI